MQNDNRIKGAISLIADDGESATVNNLPVSVLQGIYHEITGKTETIKKKFRSNEYIRFVDVSQLVDLFKQTLEQYDKKSESVAISISHFGTGERLTFSSFEKFKLYDISKKEPTRSLNITFQFLIANPNFGKFQNYRINVEINSYKLWKDKKNLVYGDRYFGDSENYTELQIDYVDYMTAKNFMNVFEEWVQRLDRFKVSSEPGVLSRVRSAHMFTKLISVFFISVAVSPLIFLFLTYLNGLSTTQSKLYLLFMMFMLMQLIIHMIGDIFSEYLYFGAWQKGNFTFLELNAGDVRNREVYIEDIKKWKYIRNAIFSGVFVAFCVGLAVNYTYDFVK
jgi:hypothetical protein